MKLPFFNETHWPLRSKYVAWSPSTWRSIDVPLLKLTPAMYTFLAHSSSAGMSWTYSMKDWFGIVFHITFSWHSPTKQDNTPVNLPVSVDGDAEMNVIIYSHQVNFNGDCSCDKHPTVIFMEFMLANKSNETLWHCVFNKGHIHLVKSYKSDILINNMKTAVLCRPTPSLLTITFRNSVLCSITISPHP